MRNAIGLVDWYLLEMLRITKTHVASEGIQKAEKLRIWLNENWSEDKISVRVVTQRGPSVIRDSDTAKKAIAKLAENHWLVPLPGGAIVGGQRATDAWLIKRSI